MCGDITPASLFLTHSSMSSVCVAHHKQSQLFPSVTKMHVLCCHFATRAVGHFYFGFFGQANFDTDWARWVCCTQKKMHGLFLSPQFIDIPNMPIVIWQWNINFFWLFFPFLILFSLFFQQKMSVRIAVWFHWALASRFCGTAVQTIKNSLFWNFIFKRWKH